MPAPATPSAKRKPSTPGVTPEKSETLKKINEALRRLEEGTYGNCFECGEEIAQARLRALPFAVRCKDCEEARETAEQRERMQAQKRGASTLFFDMSN